MDKSSPSNSGLKLRPELTCLHCWARFPPEQVLWVSEHRDLLGDALLGEAQQRFLPSRFTLDGKALDARGLICHEIACPRCHLSLPRCLLEFEPLFVSILGSPSCGKSYFLAALAWSLRKILPSTFGIDFTDADAVANQNLIGYEERLFLNDVPEEAVPLATLIAKTQLQGDLYHSVRHGQLVVSYPRPFSFLLQPTKDHPRHDLKTYARVMCLYDNAGEHFLPGNDSVTSPGTRHLATSSLLLFLYDPTQDRRLDDVLARAREGKACFRTRHAGRQEAILREAAARIQRHLNLPRDAKHKVPLIVVVTKADAWGSVLGDDLSWSDPWIRSSRLSVAAVDLARVHQLSIATRSFLNKFVPEIVQSAETFAETVHYLPVSALGHTPTLDSQGQPWIRPTDIAPRLITLPAVFGLALGTRDLFFKASFMKVARPTRSQSG